MARVKKDDIVEVISGYYTDERGQQVKTGRVLKVLPEEGKVLVEGINMVYRHTKPNRANPQGGRIRREAPIALSKVMPIDPTTGKATRVRTVVEKTAEGKIVRKRVTVGRTARDEKGKALRTADGKLQKTEGTTLS